MASPKKVTLRAIFARNVRHARLEKGFSQEVLADVAELHRTYISSVERCERNITLDTVERIAAALGISPLDLLKDGL